MKCIKNIWLISVIVNILLHSAVLNGQADTICFNDTMLYKVPVSKNSAYDWIVSGGSIIYSSVGKDSVIVVWNESTGLHSVEVVRLTDTYCTSDPEVLEVFVYKPSVNLGEDMEICEGSNELLVLEPDYEEYYWNNQQGTNEYVVNAGGIINLEVKDKYGCWANDSITVTEIYNPEPEFIVVTDTLNQVFVSNLTDSTWQYHWDFGDGTYSDEYSPEIHNYPGFGTYEITLNANANGCSGAISKEVSIPEPLNSDFMAVFDGGCAPAEVSFINRSTGAETYHWDFGNGNSSDAENPKTIYSEAGNYEVTLYAYKDESAEITNKTIIVHEAPVAEFDVSSSEIMPSEDVNFSNNSSDAVNYTWDFGDGESSELFEPSHSYLSAGVYDVSLSVWSEYGCSDSLTIEDAVTVKQDCRLAFPTGFIPDKNGPSGGYYNPAQETDDNEVFHPVYKQVDAYELKIYTRWGELIFVSKNIDVGWDGYYKGKLAPQDTYVYEVNAICPSGEEISTIGSVTLIY